MPHQHKSKGVTARKTAAFLPARTLYREKKRLPALARGNALPLFAGNKKPPERGEVPIRRVSLECKID